MSPLISVIIPVYNCQEFIDESINSIINQTYSNFEIIIVDDCSTDNTLKIIEKIPNKRIKLLRNASNLGPANSINNGILISKGDYIAIMHADDISHCDRLANQINYLLKNQDVHLLATSYFEINEIGLVIGKKITRSNKNIKDRMFLHNVICHPTVMFKKSLKIIEPLYFPGLRVNEDYELWLRLLNQGYRIDVLKTPLLYYRVHSQQQSKLKNKLEQESFEKLRNSFWQYHGKDKRILSLLREFNSANLLKSLIEGVKFNQVELNYLKGLLHHEIKSNDQKLLVTYFQIIIKSKFRMFDIRTLLRTISKYL